MESGVNASYYIFAIVVFFMVVLLGWLFSRMFKSGKKNQPARDAQEQENRLFKLYQNLEDMMDSFEGYVIEQQEIIEESVKRVTGVERRLQSVYARLDKLGEAEQRAQEIQASGLKPAEKEPDISAPLHVDVQTPDEADIINLIQYEPKAAARAPQGADVASPASAPEEDNTPMARHHRVLELYRAGKTPEDIARELGLTQGETSMIVAMSKEKYLW